MRVQPDPVPPRHTFDDDSSSDDESAGDPSNRQVSEYQDVDVQTPPKPKERLMELNDIKVSLKEEIQESNAVVIGVELLHDVDKWFGTSCKVGTLSAEIEKHEPTSLAINYHPEHKIYTIGVQHQPPLSIVPLLAHKILETLHPTNLVILTSSNSVPSSIPISLLRTSTTQEALGGVRADPNPLFSNRRRVTMQDIESRVHAAKNPKEVGEIPLLQPPNMIQGIAASLMSLAEVHGIHGTCFVISAWIGEELEKRDVEIVVRKLQDCLKGVEVNSQDVLNGWKHAFGASGAEKSSIYL